MDQLDFDVVVVGSGSAGAVLAARLAASEPDLRVAVLEAGGAGVNPLIRVPLMTGLLHRGRYANWCYRTEPEPALGGRQLAWPRGKVLGGSSAINGMIYVRGLPSDYDLWAQDGLPDWSHERVLPHFERTVRPAGATAPDPRVPVGRPPSSNPLFDVFVEAGRQAGWPVSKGFNVEPFGVGRYDFTIERGERWSTARTFLAGPSRPANLTVLTRALVLRIGVEGGRARFVDVRFGKRPFRIRAREIVLSAGAVNSPTLLLRSGIGPAEELRALGIPVVHDLPGVGRNLQDHLLVRVQHACTQPITLHNLMRPDQAALAVAQALLFRKGPATSFPMQAGAYLKSRPELDLPDLQCHFVPGLSSAKLRLPSLKGQAGPSGHGFFANCYKMRPLSRGRITLRSADPEAAPRIEPNYLADPRDLETLREGIRRLREIFAQPAFDAYRGPELAPGPDVSTDGELDAYIRRAADTVFHPTGTCRMGRGSDAVVDGELRVHGLEGLTVADASIMPSITSTNTHAPSMMIGQKAAGYLARRLGVA